MPTHHTSKSILITHARTCTNGHAGMDRILSLHSQTFLIPNTVYLVISPAINIHTGNTWQRKFSETGDVCKIFSQPNLVSYRIFLQILQPSKNFHRMKITRYMVYARVQWSRLKELNISTTVSEKNFGLGALALEPQSAHAHKYEQRRDDLFLNSVLVNIVSQHWQITIHSHSYLIPSPAPH